MLALGLVATLPLGAVVGALFDNPRNMGLIAVPIMGTIAISGIFYPINSLPGWVQGVAQALPIYWLGWGCDRHCSRTPWRPSRSGTRGDTWRRSACSAPGRSSA